MKLQNKIKLKFDKALKIFLDNYKNNKNINSILLTGSYAISNLDKNSDIDVYIILNNSKTKERGNIWINGIEIEYFINSIKQVKKYLQKELIHNKYNTATILSEANILYQKDNQVNILISQAKKIIKNKKPMNKSQIESAKYKIDDLRKDLEDVYLKKDFFSFNIILNKIITECLKIFFDISLMPWPKIKKIKKEILNTDPKLENYISQIYKKTKTEEKFKSAVKLIIHIEKLLGGKRTKKWKLKSLCD